MVFYRTRFNSMAPGSVRKPLVTLFQRSRLEECLLFAQPGRSCRSISPLGDRCMPRQRKSRTQAAYAKPIQRKHAAGIDIGATSIYVAVPVDRDPQPVRSFQTFTEDLHRLADWLQHCGIKTVAMESTGVFWVPLFQILEQRGFEVCLVNARHVKNVPGRKTDVSDCPVAAIPAFGGPLAGFVPASAAGLRTSLPAAAS
jgi:hypothetical protein